MNSNIGLALSGGGVRAMAFHAGLLHQLAEQNKLENITHISTVSGGSLLVGLVYHYSDYHWPTSEEYIATVYPCIKKLLTSTSLQTSSILKLLNPINFQYIFSRANLISKAIEDTWQIQKKLSALPITPFWSLNGTTAETGRRFRFKRDNYGDYEIGYAKSVDFPLAMAMAMSAAFPVGIGPLTIKTKNHQWERRINWDDPDSHKVVIEPPFKKLHLYDGGVYDNLGLEPIFDMGKQQFKVKIDHLIVSDGGSPFPRKKIGSALNPFRLNRIINILIDQTRSLRVRSLFQFIETHHNKITYAQIGSTPLKQLIMNLNSYIENHYSLWSSKTWLDEKSIQAAAKYPTNLKKVSSAHFDQIARHGNEVMYLSGKLSFLFKV